MNILRDVEDAVPYNQTLRMSQLGRGWLSSADSVKSQNDCHRQSATPTSRVGSPPCGRPTTRTNVSLHQPRASFTNISTAAASVPPDQSVGSPPCGRPTIRTNINKSRETTKWENQNNFNELIRRTSHGASGTPPPTIK